MTNVLISAVGLAVALTATAAGISGRLQDVNKAKHSVVCKDIRNCNVDVTPDISEEEMDALSQSYDAEIDRLEKRYRRPLSEGEKRAVLAGLLKPIHDAHMRRLAKQGYKVDSQLRRELFNEFVDSVAKIAAD